MFALNANKDNAAVYFMYVSLAHRAFDDFYGIRNSFHPFASLSTRRK